MDVGLDVACVGAVMDATRTFFIRASHGIRTCEPYSTSRPTPLRGTYKAYIDRTAPCIGYGYRIGV